MSWDKPKIIQLHSQQEIAAELQKLGIKSSAPKSLNYNELILSIVPTTKTEAVEVVPPLEVEWGISNRIGQPGFEYAISNFNNRWDTATKVLRGTYIDGTGAGLVKGFEEAHKIMMERVAWIYAANHGYLDHDMIQIRFRA